MSGLPVWLQIPRDSNVLTYLVTSPKLSPTDHCWLCSLVVFDFKIFYRCGKANGDADGLFRIPVSGGEGNRDSLSDEQYVRPFLDRLKPLQGGGGVALPVHTMSSRPSARPIQ